MKNASYLKGLKVSKYREGSIVGWLVDGYLREKILVANQKESASDSKAPMPAF
jgi:hypothetical protein